MYYSLIVYLYLLSHNINIFYCLFIQVWIYTNFNIYSFNCEGIKRIISSLNDVQCDILCLQELWLLDSNSDCLHSIHDHYLFVGMSCVDASEKILSDRPKGGVAIM